ncbi:unnamed protein product, partial [Aureobasidium pullulans]
IDPVMLNLDLTRFERESVARLREEEARYKGYRRRYKAPISIYTSPDALLNGALIASAERMYRILALNLLLVLLLTTLRRRVKELSATLPSVRRIPTFRDKEDPTLMSGGAGGPVTPTLNASSPIFALREYDLLYYRSPRLDSTSRGRNAARTYTPEHILLANRTRRLYAVSPKERKQRRRNFEATTKAKRLINAEELIEEERRATERSRRLSYGDPPIFDLRSPSRSRSPSPNFLASHPVSAIKVL